jgi:choline-phosphate cytidylyltransferase
MTKVITYGTYDLLHYGHVRLLERAKALGDYLIVGVTADDFDRQRGKINVQQTLEERIAAIRETGLADQIIVEEYEGQKIDDILKYNVDIFAIGSDWLGKFDYLKEYCKVVYLDRTKGVSSTELREKKVSLKLGLVGYSKFLNKIYKESKYVNGLDIVGIYANDLSMIRETADEIGFVTDNYDELLEKVDAVYVHSHPDFHYEQVKHALKAGKHVLCEAPLALSESQSKELYSLAEEQHLFLMPALKTAYSIAYSRMLLLVKSGRIGKIVSIDAVCTSLKEDISENSMHWGSLYDWGMTGLLPVLQLLGTNYEGKKLISSLDENHLDRFTEIILKYQNAVATVRAATGVKSEGELVISGTEGYIYVPAPWWKTDYFEIRFEHPENNKRYFYQLEGEGIRNELVEFVKRITSGNYKSFFIEQNIAEALSEVSEDFENEIDLLKI